MKMGKTARVRIVKRQNYASPEKRMTDESRQRDTLLALKRTVLSWIHELENKRDIELKSQFSNLFGVKGVAGGSTSLKLSRQLVVKKRSRNTASDAGAGEGVK